VPHILVIDDSAAIRALLRTILEDRGYQVTEAANGAKGLTAFREEPADVVLCDLFMPHTDGLEVIGKLTHEFPGVRIIAMSGGNLDGRLNGLLPVADALGAAAVLPKPFSQATVLALVETVLSEQPVTRM
jgi:CheY-like chemotaxis protein